MIKLLKNSIYFSSVLLLFASCGKFGKGKSSWNKKDGSSDATGWHYNDKNQGGYYVAKAKDIKTGPGLVFVQGGTFTMGATEEDIMGDWNNVPRRITVNSFFIDKCC